VSEAVDGQEAASATSNNSAGRRIPQPRHAEIKLGRWLASLTRLHMLPNRVARRRPFRQEINAVSHVEDLHHKAGFS